MRLFDSYPILQDDAICLRRMTLDDADDLRALTQNERVYRYEPTILYELRYEDKREVLERMDDECMATHESLLLGVYLKDEDGAFAGIAEVYGYDPSTQEAYIGGRLAERYWGRSIAKHIVRLLTDYLFACDNVRMVSAHVMTENARSCALMRGSGFEMVEGPFADDWGHGPVSVCKFVCVKD